MTPAQRCDEIVRLIESVLVETQGELSGPSALSDRSVNAYRHHGGERNGD
jgi:hypothetical protein